MTQRLALALLLGGLACSRQNASGEPKAAEVRPAVSIAEVGEAADADEATQDPDVAALPPWVRDMFDPALRRTYAWSYEVPTHGEDPDSVGAQGKVRCRTDGPTRHELGPGWVALVSCEACEFTSEGQDDGFEPELGSCYVATTAGLWLVGKPPKDEDEVLALVDTVPYLPGSPEPIHKSNQREEDGFPYEEWTSVSEQELTVMDRSVTAWCRGDGNSLFYGWSRNLCFAPGLGLVGFDWDGRNGPSTETYQLVAIDRSVAD